MILWFVLTVTTSVATVLVAAPLVLRFERARLAGAGSRDPSREVEQPAGDRASDTERPDGESGRPAVAADCAERHGRTQLLPHARFVAIGATIVLGVVAIYAVTSGRDHNALAGSSMAAPAAPVSATPVAATSGSSAPASPPPSAARMTDGQKNGAPALPSVEEMAKRLASRLEKNPRDPEGWRLLGLSYANMGRPADAAVAFARAIELTPGNADLRGERVDALVRAAGGQVTPEASAAIQEGLALAPGQPQLRYYKGLAEEQAGDKQAAYALWSEIAKADVPQEPWADDLRQHLADLGRELGVAGATQASLVQPGTRAAVLDFLQSREGNTGPAAPAAGAEASTPAQASPPADNSAMIRGMVERLASRLEQAPNDVDGWIKLMRSRVVLGQPELAKQALERALKAAGDDAQAREKITSAAEQLGVR